MREVSTVMSLLVALALSPASAQVRPPEPGACDSSAYSRALAESRWIDALAEAERCYDDFDHRPPAGTWRMLHVANRWYYRLAAAQLLAIVGRADAAETILSAASHRAWSSGMASGEVFAATRLLALTDAFLRERRGAFVDAYDRYSQVESAAAKGRRALLALGAGNDVEARLQGHLGAVGKDPTALYVLGALAELRGSRPRAWYYYSQAQSELRSLAAGNPTLPIAFFEGDRIRTALAQVPGPDSPRVVSEDGLRTYVDTDGRRIAGERWPGVLAIDTVAERQRRYNEWVATKRDLGSSLLELAPQYPRRFAADTEHSGAGLAAIPIPEHLEVTGVLDLDTVAVGYYRAVAQWDELCAAAGLSRQALGEPFAVLGTRPPKPADDSEAVRWLLAEAYYDLRRLQAFLSGAVMRTAAGETLDAVEETRRYPANLATLREGLANATLPARGPRHGLPPEILDRPPDFVTAHIPAEGFTDAFAQHLLLSERAVRGRLFLARSLLETKAPELAVDG